MRLLTIVILLLIGISCSKKSAKNSLERYINDNASLEQTDLIACAANLSLLASDLTYPTDVFFYPIPGSYNFRYFECEDLADGNDYSKYYEKETPQARVFNGYLYKFKNSSFEGERMGIVTYESAGKLHISSPIRLKTNVKPTEYNYTDLQIQEDSITPNFTWQDGKIKENVIYFQVISDTLGNLISGTYTYEKTFTFYNLSNVVLNITKGTPELKPNRKYHLLIMGVSEDNWVNLIFERAFYTN